MSRLQLRRALWRNVLGVGGGGGGGLTFLLRDDFLTDEAAPLASPRTAEPGPGMLTITDTGNKLSISSGALQMLGNANGNPGFWSSTAYARRAGLAHFVKWSAATISQFYVACWDTNQAAAPVNGFSMHGTDLRIWDGGSSLVVGAIASSIDYTVATILRATGYFNMVKGGAFSQWTLVWVNAASSDASLYAANTQNSASLQATLDTFRVCDLPAPFDTDYGLATQRIASPVANDTIASEANAVIEDTWTAVTGETFELSVRRTDDNNRWILRGDQGGSTVKLIEVNAGSETERASAAQTWTNTTSYRVVVVQDGNTIRGYVANVLKWTYSSASFNNTATGIKTNKAGSNLISWPRTLSGAAASYLDQAVA